MLIYPKTKKGVQKDSPVWKEDNFRPIPARPKSGPSISSRLLPP